MIVVTGMPRTGTSLQMLILKNLGFSLAGDQYLTEYTKEFNPTGIWEVRGLPYRGLRTPMKEDVIKLMLRGLFRSNLHIFKKMILCIRDPRESILSQRAQTDYQGDEHNIDQWLIMNNILASSIDKNPKDYVHVIDYADVMWSPKTEVERLAAFLGVKPNQKAIDCVDPTLHRSKKYKIKRTKKIKACEKYYAALRHYIS